MNVLYIFILYFSLYSTQRGSHLKIIGSVLKSDFIPVQL